MHALVYMPACAIQCDVVNMLLFVLSTLVFRTAPVSFVPELWINILQLATDAVFKVYKVECLEGFY